MLDKFAGYKTQIRVLEKQLKDMDHSKLNPTKVKELTEAIQNLKNIVKEKEDKRQSRRKKKEEAAKATPEVEKEAAPEPKIDKNPAVYVPESLKEKEKIVEKVEKDPKVAPHIISYKLDDEVAPVRGSGNSWGIVMRSDYDHEKSPHGLVYVSWQDGDLKNRDVFGGYYGADLQPRQKKEAVSTEYVPREQVYNLEADLKSNYEQSIKNLEEEHKMALDKGEATWAHRLTEKINDLRKAYDERFPKTAENGTGGTDKLKVVDFTPPHDKDPQEKATGYGGDRPYGAMTAPNTDENSLPLEGSLHKEAINVTVAEKLFTIRPLGHDALENTYNYDVAAANGSRLFKITAKAELGQADFTSIIEKELANKKVAKIATLVANLAFLKKGALVTILSEDKSKKQVKFAALDNSIRGWAPASKFAAFDVPEANLVPHADHQDEVLSQSGNELLVTCPANSTNVMWRTVEAPPATPESLNPDVTAAAKEKELCPHCGSSWYKPEENWCPTCIRSPKKEAAAGANVPKDFPVQPLKPGQKATDPVTCGTCGLTWDDAIITSWTPAPSARCPFEYFHNELGVEAAPKPNTPAYEQVMNMSKEQLAELPTLSQGQFSNLKFDDGKHRIWLSRMTMADGAPEDHPIEFEVLQNGRWVTAAKECSDCHGTFEGNEDEKCPTCGRFAVKKEARGCDQCDAAMINGVFCHETGCPNARKEREQEEEFDVEGSLNKDAHVRKEDGKWYVYNHDYSKRLSRGYGSKEEADKRLGQIEYFKHKGSLQPLSKKEASWPTCSVEGCNNKADSVGTEDSKRYCYTHSWGHKQKMKEADLMETKCEECGKELGPEVFLSKWPVCGKCTKKRHEDAVGRKKKADQDPMQALQTQVQGFRDRMQAVQDRLSNPPAKTADLETTQDLSKVSIEDLSSGIAHMIDMMESKVGEDISADPEVHKILEELENKLWEAESKLGIKPEIPEHEKAEPEHQEVVKEVENKEEPVEKASSVEVKADDVNNPPTTVPPQGMRWAWEPKTMSWIMVATGNTGTY